MNFSNIQIIYFSGTGCTKRAALYVKKSIESRGAEVNIKALESVSRDYGRIRISEHAQLLLLMYPVYAFNAPEPVYEWLYKIPEGSGMPVCIISVSAGGDVYPNTSCRSGCKRILAKKGYNVFYERMFIMPSNFLGSTNDHLAIRLLDILPQKAEHCASEILSGRNRRTRPKIVGRIMSNLAYMERVAARFAGLLYSAGNNCSGCGWCSRNCPRGNIRMVNGRPSFGFRCVLCQRCVYNCPSSAIKIMIFVFMKLKGGFSLEKLEERMAGAEKKSVEQAAPGFTNTDIRKYLQNVEW